MSRFYLLGGRQKKLLLKKEEEWNLYEAALIVELNTDSGEARQRVEYHTPAEARANDNASHLFKAGTIVGNTLYSCTSTEVVQFRLPDFSQIGYVSLPCFNDLHHVAPSHDGNLLVVTTGLDMAVKVTPKGEVLNYWPVLNEEPWSRFSQSVDYRTVDSTKPHQSHPNFVFELGEHVWVTRFRQRDAICVTQPGLRIDVAVQTPHDGLVFGDRVYFTTVDGQIVIANTKSLNVDQVIDLKQIGNGKALLGWCRGILPLDERRIWVAFTRVRKTKFNENILWVKHVFHKGWEKNRRTSRSMTSSSGNAWPRSISNPSA